MGGRTGPADPVTAGPMLPERLADAISEVQNSKKFPCFAWIFATWQVGVSNHWTETHETDYGIFFVKQMGPLYTMF